MNGNIAGRKIGQAAGVQVFACGRFSKVRKWTVQEQSDDRETISPVFSALFVQGGKAGAAEHDLEHAGEFCLCGGQHGFVLSGYADCRSGCQRRVCRGI